MAFHRPTDTILEGIILSYYAISQNFSTLVAVTNIHQLFKTIKSHPSHFFRDTITDASLGLFVALVGDKNSSHTFDM